MDFIESMANLTLDNFETLKDYENDKRIANIDLKELVEFVNWLDFKLFSDACLRHIALYVLLFAKGLSKRKILDSLIQREYQLQCTTNHHRTRNMCNDQCTIVQVSIKTVF